MPVPDPLSFTTDWLAAWNAHDVERVLAGFHDDVLFTSPTAAVVVPESGGVIRGKAALRDYWTRALEQTPDLWFDFAGVCIGLDLIVITFQNQLGRVTSEVLRFDGGLVVEGHATHLALVPAPEGWTPDADG